MRALATGKALPPTSLGWSCVARGQVDWLELSGKRIDGPGVTRRGAELGG